MIRVSLRSIASRTALLLSGLGLAAVLSGCTMGQVQLSGPQPITGQLNLSGNVHGGRNGVINSTIQLWSVGTSAYGAGATSLISSTVQTDSFGSFNITGDYTCTSGTYVYITATGGNPGLTAGTNNLGIELAAALGDCGNLNKNSYITINEVTTAAMAFALGQYFTPPASYAAATTSTAGSVTKATTTDVFGSSGTTQATTGIQNAFKTAVMLANNFDGTAVVSTSLAGAGSTLTAVPESSKLYLIANILAICVNSDNTSGSDCQTILFPDTASTGVTVSDTLQAAVQMSLNPTSNNANGSSTNLTALYNSAQATGAPYAGAQATQPSDWTMGIQYQDNVGTFFLAPQNVAVDKLGDVWVLSQVSGIGSLVEVGPTGTPLSNISTLNENGDYSSAGAPTLTSPKTTTTTLNMSAFVFTTTFGQTNNNPAISPRNLAIDPSGNVWFTTSSAGVNSTTGGSNGTTTAASGSNIFEVATTSGLPTGSTYSFATGKSSYGLSIDSAGDVFAGQASTSSYFSFYEFPYNATVGNSIYTPAAFLPYTVSSVQEVPEYTAPDKSGNQWYSNGSNGVFEATGLSASTCTNTASTPTLCQPATSTYSISTIALPTGANTPFSNAEGTTGMWFASQAKSTGTPGLFLYLFGATTGTLYGSSTTFSAPAFVAADGSGNMWTANGVAATATANETGGSISEVNAAGTILSPANGSATNAPGFDHLGLQSGYGIAVDPSGNVWVANNLKFSAACTVAETNISNTCSSIFELVGAAAPVITPIAAYQTTGPKMP
jgi:hypothetical protein